MHAGRGARGRAEGGIVEHDVGREVVGAADQRRADPVGVHRHRKPLELLDLLHGEALGVRGHDEAVHHAVEEVAEAMRMLFTDTPGPIQAEASRV